MEEICWQGPFSWPGFEQTNRLTTMPDIKGVYLHSFEYNDGYILCSPGITTSTRKRFSQHTRAFFKGKYNVLDIEAQKSVSVKKFGTVGVTQKHIRMNLNSARNLYYKL